jgi:23S rRNA (uracil1939-C5)-methyltransferase
MKINDEITSISIEKLVNEGLALNYINNKTVLIYNAIPGDIVTIKIIKKKKRIFFAKVIKVEKKSEFRKTSNCIHSKTCGGCIYQEIDYATQIKFKETVLKDIINYNLPELENIVWPIKKCNKIQYHRNKMEFAFSKKDSKLILGLKEKNSFDNVVEVEDCKLLSKESNEFLKFTTNYFSNINIELWDSREQKGCLSHLAIRHSKAFDNYMVNIKAHSYNDTFNNYATALTKEYKKITSVNLILINEKKGSPTTTQSINLIGTKTLKENIGDLTFLISPLSFFQTNTEQTNILYDTIKELASIKENSKLLDLYCGTGTIGLYLCDKEGFVTGIEEIEAAIENAKENANINKIKNTNFYAGKVKNILKFNEFDITTIVVDPPRSGMTPKALKRTAELRCKDIIYVSCNPITLMRDIKEFVKLNYKVTHLIPVDMFPHTYHLECVVKLRLN